MNPVNGESTDIHSSVDYLFQLTRRLLKVHIAHGEYRMYKHL
jgi:hypothetical protein